MNMEKIQNLENIEKKEKGSNVYINLKFIRHGERDLDGNLQDLGREVTKVKAMESKLNDEDFDLVKAIGSDAGPTVLVDGDQTMARSLETAHIYAKEVGKDKVGKSRRRSILSYEGLIASIPYDHRAIYDSFIPSNFDSLSPKEKAEASKIANQKTLEHLIGLDTGEANLFKKEVAGSFAYVIEYYARVAKRLKPDSKVLIPAGSHGGLMELLLQLAMVRNDNGNEVLGFSKLDEIGGDFDPSEAFSVFIETNSKGDVKKFKLSFDNEKRPDGDIYLDANKLKELSEFYQSLHKEKN